MTRLLAWVGGVLAVVAVATGVVVTFRYRPDASGTRLAFQRLHALSAIAFAVVLVVGLAALIWERRPDRRHGLPAFAVVAVLAVVLAVEVTLGRRIAWDQVAMYAVPSPDVLHRVHGVLLHDLPIKFVLVHTSEYGVGEFRRRAWVHILAVPLVVAAGAGFVVWWTRRTARPEARPPRDRAPATDAPGEGSGRVD